jgi:hypothetical protein
VRAARRARRVSAISIAVLVLGGCALFLFESQTFGRLALAIGVGWGLMWIALRHLTRTGGDLLEDLRRRRWTLIGIATALVAAGWVVFFAVWEELGLLLVVLGALPLLMVLGTVRREPMLSPMDGPPFGETEQH